MKPTPPEALLKYFTWKDKKTYWEIWCKHKGCEVGYRLMKDVDGKTVRAGLILGPLNHAFGHKVPVGERSEP